MPRFRLDDDGVLCVDTTCLWHRPPALVHDDEPINAQCLRALGRVAAQALASATSPDGTPAMQTQHCFGTLPDALAVLVAHGASVQVADAPTARPRLPRSRTVRWWRSSRGAEPEHAGGAGAPAGARPSDETADPHARACHAYCVKLPIAVPLVAHGLQWSGWLVDEPEVAVRVARKPSDVGRVFLYRGGVLWSTNSLATGCRHAYAIDVRDARIPDAKHPDDAIPVFPRCADASLADQFARVFLVADEVAALSSSRIVRTLLARARAWPRAAGRLARRRRRRRRGARRAAPRRRRPGVRAYVDVARALDGGRGPAGAAGSRERRADARPRRARVRRRAGRGGRPRAAVAVVGAAAAIVAAVPDALGRDAARRRPARPTARSTS